MKKRKLVYTIIAAGMSILLSACAGQNNPAVSANPPSDVAVNISTSEITEESLMDYPVTSEELTDAVYMDAFKAYYHQLDEKEHPIENYAWHMGYNGGEPKQVALWDVYGDETPELLYFDVSAQQNGLAANLNIYTYKNGKLLELNRLEGVDYKDFPETYYLFQTSDGKELYMFIGIGDAAPLTNYYIKFTENGDKLDSSSVYTQIIEENNAEYLKNDQQIDGNTFVEETDLLLEKTTDRIMTNIQYDVEELSGKSDNCFSQKGYEEALQYFDSYVEANGGWAEGEKEREAKATVTISWDEEGYDYTGPEMYYDAVNLPSCGLLVRCLQEFEDPDKEKQYSDTVTQNGSIKTQVIRVYDTDDYLQIEVEPIGPTNDNPLQTVQAAISVPGQDDISLTYDEMCIRGGTGIYVLHVCDFNQGNINVGVAGIQ